MWRPLAALLALVLGAGACTSGSGVVGQSTADGSEAPGRTGVTVEATGAAPGTPDVLRAEVGAEATRDDVETAVADANDVLERILAALREEGIRDEDVRTTDFRVHPRRDHRPEQAPVTTGYTAVHMVEVTIRAVDEAGDVLGAVTDAGGDDARVRRVAFSIEDDDSLLQEARDTAFERARTKAEHYAELAGSSLGALIAIEETPHGPVGPVPHAAPEAADTAVPVQPGEQEVHVRIVATWALD